MKRILHIILTAVLLVFTTGCSDWFSPTPVEKRMVLLYVAGVSDLSGILEINLSTVLEGYIPPKNSKDEIFLVFFQNYADSYNHERGDATLSRYYLNKSGEVVKEVITNYGSDFNAADTKSLSTVLKTAESYCKPTYRTLVFSSHGSGWYPDAVISKATSRSNISTSSGIELTSRKTESIGRDTPSDTWIDLIEFEQILNLYHWEALLLDACLMGTIEVCYQLKNCSDYIIASPTEILSNGFPYATLMEHLFHNPGEAGLTTICEDYHEMYKDSPFGSIALVKCDELDKLAQCCYEVISNNRDKMNIVQRNAMQQYGRSPYRDIYFDFKQFISTISSQEESKLFGDLLDYVVIHHSTIDVKSSYLPINKDNYCGLSCYIPSSRYPELNAYYKQLAWNQKVKVIE